MSSEDDIALEILLSPERDDLRREFAKVIELRDPEWSRFIVRSLDPSWELAQFNQPGDDLRSRLTASFSRFGTMGLEFHRGFPSRAHMSPETFLAHGDEICRSLQF